MCRKFHFFLDAFENAVDAHRSEEDTQYYVLYRKETQATGTSLKHIEEVIIAVALEGSRAHNALNTRQLTDGPIYIYIYIYESN